MSACRKRSYESKHRALTANRRNGHTLRAYVCPACHAWHVTKERGTRLRAARPAPRP